MQRYRAIAPYLLPLVCVAALLCVAAQNKESGSDPYTPTKLQWLELHAKVCAQAMSGAVAQFGVAREERSTLVITATPHPLSGPESEVDWKVLFFALRTDIEADARHYGWDGWLTVREKVNKFVIQPDAE